MTWPNFALNWPTINSWNFFVFHSTQWTCAIKLQSIKRLSVIRRNRLWELYSTEIHKDFFLIIALKSESGVEARELFLLNHSDKLLSAVLISWCWIQWDRPSDISFSLSVSELGHFPPFYKIPWNVFCFSIRSLIISTGKSYYCT